MNGHRTYLDPRPSYRTSETAWKRGHMTYTNPSPFRRLGANANGTAPSQAEPEVSALRASVAFAGEE